MASCDATDGNRRKNPYSMPKDKYEVSANECGAMRLLRRDGYTKSLLAMMFHVSREDTVAYHAEGKCKCNTDVAPVKRQD